MNDWTGPHVKDWPGHYRILPSGALDLTWYSGPNADAGYYARRTFASVAEAQDYATRRGIA